MSSNNFKKSNKNSRFDSLIEEQPIIVEKRQNSFLNPNQSNMQSSSSFMTGNNPPARNYSNMFIDQKTEKERQIKQQQDVSWVWSGQEKAPQILVSLRGWGCLVLTLPSWREGWWLCRHSWSSCLA